ncbi:MAG: DUF3267 domain-containing protein [Anaerolineales bacterium]
MNPTKTLPEPYTLAWAVDMKKDRRLHWTLQLAGMVWFFLAGFILLKIVVALRPDFVLEGQFDLWEVLAFALAALLIIFVTAALHELVHGFFFWFFTKERPKFGIGPGYAYAAAPDWYFPKGEYLVVGLAPLVVLTVVGLVAIALVPLAWVGAIFLAIVFNAGGAVGDLYIGIRIGGEARNVWVKDTGDGFEVYRAYTGNDRR